MQYRVENGSDMAAQEFGYDRAGAVSYARRKSNKSDDIFYVVALEDDKPVGHISYYHGYRDTVEGVTA